MRTSHQDGSIEFVIPSDLTESRHVQEVIEHQLRQYHYEDKEIFGIRLALEEALVNAIKHGNQMDRGKKVYVRYRILADRIEDCGFLRGGELNLPGLVLLRRRSLRCRALGRRSLSWIRGGLGRSKADASHQHGCDRRGPEIVIFSEPNHNQIRRDFSFERNICGDKNDGAILSDRSRQ